MNAEQLFLREGADYFGNRLIYRNQDVGFKSGSGLVLTANGDAEFARLSDISDVEVKVKPAVLAKTPKAKKAVVVEADPVEDAPEEKSLDDLLSD